MKVIASDTDGERKRLVRGLASEQAAVVPDVHVSWPKQILMCYV
jgi:hypothetical protein